VKKTFPYMSSADAAPILSFMDTMKCTDEIELNPYNRDLPSDERDLLSEGLAKVCIDKFGVSPVTGVVGTGAGHKAKLNCYRCPQWALPERDETSPDGSRTSSPAVQGRPAESNYRWIWVSVAGVAVWMVYDKFLRGK